MGDSYLAHGLAERPATFELSFRRLPPAWGYFVAAGIAEALDLLQRLRFHSDEVAYLESTGLFSDAFLDRLASFRFRCDVRAIPEGTVFFPNEPVLEVTGPLLEAQLIETAVLNEVHFQSLIATTASRCVDAAGGRRLVDFGLRRTHGAEAGLKAARASYLAGFDATSDVLAGQAYAIPLAGTMAHSYVECFADETAAFTAFMSSYPDRSTLLIDTYDTLAGARHAIEAARSLDRGGDVRLGGVRLDSGDLLVLSNQVRRLLDESGFPGVTIFASGNLDERGIARLLEQGAPIDGFGVGSRLSASSAAPYLDAVYKLVAFDGRPVMKLSAGKRTWPGAKQIWRTSSAGHFVGDLVLLQDEPGPPGADPLLGRVMAGGRRESDDALEAARQRAATQRDALQPQQRLLDAEPYPVEIGAQLAALAERIAQELSQEIG